MTTALALKQFFLRLILRLTARYLPDGNLSNVNRGESMEVANLQALLCWHFDANTAIESLINFLFV